MTEKQGENGRRMKREKRMAAALGLAVILGVTGCAGNDDTPVTSQENIPEEKGEPDRENDVSERQAEKDGGAGDVKNGEDGAEALVAQDGEWERERKTARRSRRTRGSLSAHRKE